LHKDEIPELQKAVAVLLRAAGRPARERVALVVEISEHGPQGPRSPMLQKLSELLMRMMRESGKPPIFFHKLKVASSS